MMSARANRRPEPAPAKCATETPGPREVVGFGRRPAALPGVRAVGSFVPRITKKAFARYGFSTAALITDWAAVVGPEVAAYTAPERVKWPRAGDRPDPDAPAADRPRPSGTLVLRVDEGRGLDVQFRASQIVERINAYFGYAAVAGLRIVQAPIERPQPPQGGRPQPSAAEPALREVAHVADPALRTALARLGTGVRAGR